MNRKQRHLGRELALLWLFQIDVGRVSVAQATSEIPDELIGVEEEGHAFGLMLAQGVYAERKRIDETIKRFARGWSLPRMAAVERNVLRIALYEITSCPEIPTSVSVDEAVEVAKRYGSEESGKFVNGILGAFIREEYEPPPIA